MAQFIYTMNRVGKLVPPKKFILKNISLSFFPGRRRKIHDLKDHGRYRYRD